MTCPMDNSPLGQLIPWTTGPMENWPHGQLAPWTMGPETTGSKDNFPMDNLPTHRQLAPWTTRPVELTP